MKLSFVILCLLLATQILTGFYSFSNNSTQSTATPIKHVIVIMMENHSFDNIFGTYPIQNETNPNVSLSNVEVPSDVLNVSKTVRPTLNQVPNGTYATEDPVESAYYSDWDNGKMDGFESNGGPEAMTYFSSSQLAIEWDWAEEYAIGDRYFSSCLCETDPNRIFSLAASNLGETQDFDPPPYVPANQSIFSELNHYGVNWAYYIEDPSSDDYPLNYFDGNYSSQIQSWNDFNMLLGQGNLPSISWVMPVGGGAYGVDQHPSYNVTEGEDWLLGIVDSVMVSPIWNTSAIFVTYDEGGGYYDNVPPPFVDNVQLGFRVPLFVISPYAKENYVSHTVMNHASILGFIDYNWQIPALNGFVADSSLPLDMFDFNPSYPGGAIIRPPLILNQTSKFPVNPQFSFGDLPYSRQGSTTETLASVGATLYVQSHPTTMPLLESLEITIGVVFLGLVVLVIWRSRRARRVDWIR